MRWCLVLGDGNFIRNTVSTVWSYECDKTCFNFHYWVLLCSFFLVEPSHGTVRFFYMSSLRLSFLVTFNWLLNDFINSVMSLLFEEWFPKLIGILEGKRMSHGGTPAWVGYTLNLECILWQLPVQSHSAQKPRLMDFSGWTTFQKAMLSIQSPHLLSSSNDYLFFGQDWIPSSICICFRERKIACWWSWIAGSCSSPNTIYYF